MLRKEAPFNGMVEESEEPSSIDNRSLTQDANNQQNYSMVLECVKGTPIELRDLFYNSQWSPARRIACTIFLIIGALIGLLTVVALISGTIKTLNYINERDRLAQTGMFMIPDVVQSSYSILAFNPKTTVSGKNNEIEKYVTEIGNFIDDYVRKCKQKFINEGGLQCEVTKYLPENCNRKNSFGFYNGEPCIVIGLRKLGYFRPTVDQSFLRNIDTSDYSYRMMDVTTSKSTLPKYKESHFPVICKNVTSRFAYFMDSPQRSQPPFNYTPSEGLRQDLLMNYGENDLGPIMFLQLFNLTNTKWSRIECTLQAKNLDEFRGQKNVIFDYRISKDYDPTDDIQSPY